MLIDMKFVLFSLFCVFLIPIVSLAQLDLPGSTAEIELSPQFPAPDQTVRVSLNAYTFDTTGATIRWYINGVENTELQNNRSISLRAGALGEKTAVQILLTLRDGRIVTAQNSFTVSDIDLIIDAYTLVPSFYKGRPLPSVGSTIQVVALPNVGDNTPPEGYSYTWRFNNKVVEGGSVFGGYVGLFPMPVGNAALLQVDASDSNGNVVARKSISIPNHAPELLFYADNPLRGLSRITIPKDYQLLGSEVTLRAEPYFMDSNILNINPHIEWKVEGRSINNPSDDPQTITLQNAGGGGRFTVEFHLRNLQQLLQGVRDDFNIIF